MTASAARPRAARSRDSRRRMPSSGVNRSPATALSRISRWVWRATILIVYTPRRTTAHAKPQRRIFSRQRHDGHNEKRMDRNSSCPLGRRGNWFFYRLCDFA